MSDVVDLAEDPWDMLAGLNLTTVVYYLKPDVPILSQRTETGIRKAVGSLTESFNYAFSHCLTSKQKGSKTCYLSHRMFYEAISFHWHKRGRLNRLFMPAIVVSINGLIHCCGGTDIDCSYGCGQQWLYMGTHNKSTLGPASVCGWSTYTTSGVGRSL